MREFRPTSKTIGKSVRRGVAALAGIREYADGAILGGRQSGGHGQKCMLHPDAGRAEVHLGLAVEVRTPSAAIPTHSATLLTRSIATSIRVPCGNPVVRTP